MHTIDIHLESHQDVHQIEYDRIQGGTLVYVLRSDESAHRRRRAGTERTLHGFADVTDWDAIRKELIRRGHDIGALHHLPTFDSNS